MNIPTKTNTLVRQVLKQIIDDQPSSRRTDIEELKLNEAITYLQRKIDRQQAEIKVISDQLGREIEAKEHLLLLLNEEKDKNNKLIYHLNHSNRTAAESKKKLAKAELQEGREAKLKEEFQLKMGKCRDILRKKEDLLAKATARLQEFEETVSHIPSIEAELKDLRGRMIEMRRREEELERENQALRREAEQQREQLQAKDEALLFSQEHLRRLREEYLQMEYDQEQSRQLQIDMKELLEQQNRQIKKLHDRQLSNSPSLPSSQICSQQPEWDLGLFKDQLRSTIYAHMREAASREALEEDILLIFQAMESSFISVLRRSMSQEQ